MIDKFNFYDVYGYVLPGAVFVAVLWIPFGLVQGLWPPEASWSSALIVGAATYIMGHLLQNVATNAIPSRRTTRRNRYPSETCLDPNDSELPTAIKAEINRLIGSQFGLDLQIDREGDGVIDKVRNSAFLLARQVLIQGKAVSYAEQFQGMYTLTRGLYSAFWIACFYWIGWAIAGLKQTYMTEGAIILLATASLGLILILVVRGKVATPETKHMLELVYALGLLFLFLAAGTLAGTHSRVTMFHALILIFLAACMLLACLRLRTAYDFFATRFASTVWRDYLAFNVTSRASPQAQIKDA